MNNNIKLYNGDCLEVMKDIEDKSIDMILCDLPYGTTRCNWDIIIPFEYLWDQYNRIIKDNGAIVLFGSEPFSSYLRMSNLKKYKYDWIWEKPKGTGHLNAKKQPMRYSELISVFYGKQCLYNPQKTYGHKPTNSNSVKSYKETELYNHYEKIKTGGSTERYPRNILKFNNVNSAHGILHPTQKPTDLLEYLIKTYTNENEIILDNCMGSGSTGVACLNTKRKFIGIEKDENYFNISKERIGQAYVNLSRLFTE